jgi:hypothetical protein
MKYRKITQNANLSISEWEHLIDERIFSERDRYIMKRLLLDDVSYESISEEVGLSTRYTKTIASKSMKILLEHIKGAHK